ncbi:DUF2268 domain-containing putative Zn-dependent protease [Methylobacterium pseudosasicola]|uniref:Predicted Zn-dependent protease n=1 Tax=Methylobacterium pseudosasicola TaxID=582667 RepID=A0A1I4L044_9HYPH|nr:DUF2268 domain-containing putative Zn-dependent protease [Methylobacterium pseudosasicola]SFL84395.1 Predicted Zn-dependent protease [Methylobacterium pseudosasicola]
MSWHVHWLEASGDLLPWRDTVAAEIAVARDAIARVLPLPSLDILVERRPGETIPETGTAGRAYRPSLFSLTLDPDNPNFATSLGNGDIRRTVVHEVHHCLRMAGPGYGATLGEALVSEGLAGRFVSHLFGTPPEPWESAVSDAVLEANRPDPAALADTGHNHAAWFYGRGGRYPRWLGYTLGYRIVGDWLEAGPAPDGDAWVHVPANKVLAAARGRTLAEASMSA